MGGGRRNGSKTSGGGRLMLDAKTFAFAHSGSPIGVGDDDFVLRRLRRRLVSVSRLPSSVEQTPPTPDVRLGFTLDGRR